MKLPATIGKYELIEFLGGGMSEVYRARDTILGRTVAVKLLTPAAARNEETRSRFLLEARVSSSVAHDHIITTYDYGEQDGIPYLVLEFLTGCTLKQLLANEPELPLARRVVIAHQTARAIEYVHERGLIHRDIKPDNIHIDQQGRVKLMDFGIAKSEDTSLTQAGFALGTPHYVAPEMVMGAKPAPTADIYSYGVLLFELFAGRRPIEGETFERILYLTVHEPISFAPLQKAGVPAEMEVIIRACLERNPAARPASMSAIVQQLEPMLPTATPSQPIAVRRQARLSPAMIAAAGLLALFLAVGVGYLLLRTQARAAAFTLLEHPAGDMVLVPAGAFLHGPDRKRETLAAFYIDLTEVTNEAYENFCRATGRPLPKDFPRGNPAHPVVNVTIADAEAFARWAGKRLPTEKEWQRAARGSDGRPYPWGEQHNPSLANLKDNPDDSWQHVVSAESYRHGRSPVSAYQMTGNVKEFTADRTAPTVLAMQAFQSLVTPPPAEGEPWILVKGGSFQNRLAETVLYAVEPVPTRYAAPDLGFRCAKDGR